MFNLNCYASLHRFYSNDLTQQIAVGVGGGEGGGAKLECGLVSNLKLKHSVCLSISCTNSESNIFKQFRVL